MDDHDNFLRSRLAPAQPPGRAGPQPRPQANDPKAVPPSWSAPPRPGPAPHRPEWGGIDISQVAPKPRRPSPQHGWRRIVYRATFGLINPGPSTQEKREAADEAAITSALHGNFKVGVLGKGGVGKTTIAACVGSIFAELRQQDRVVAVDADTAFGRLRSRIDPRSTGSFWELTADKNLRSFTDVITRVGRNSAGLRVLGGEPASGPRRVLDPAIS